MAVDFSKLDFSRKLGPLPIGVWALIAGGGLGLYLYTRQDGEPIEDEAFEDTSVLEGVGEGPGYTHFPPPTDETPQSDETIRTNRQWLRYAIDKTVAETDLNSVVVTRVATRYINEQPLGGDQRAVLRTILDIAGSPPNPPNIVNRPDRSPKPQQPPKPPGPSPRDGKWYEIKSRGETLQGIAGKFYQNPQQRWRDIFNANKQGANRPGSSKGWMRGPNDIQADRWLWIPGPTKG